MPRGLTIWQIAHLCLPLRCEKNPLHTRGLPAASVRGGRRTRHGLLPQKGHSRRRARPRRDAGTLPDQGGTPEGKRSALLEGFRYSTILIDGYWALNPRRFSFPAALSQSKRQKRSAGSILIGAAIAVDLFEIEDQTVLEDGDLERGLGGQYLLGAGYGYNWVPGGGRLLVHASMIPMFPLGDKDVTQYKNKEEEVEHLDGFSMSGLGRAGVFYYFSDRFYSGFILTNRLRGTWEKDKPFVSENSWYLRVPLIYRF